MKFNITSHCKDRYIERVLNYSGKYDNLFRAILSDLKTGINITSQLSSDVPRFILYVKERYGSDKGYNFIKKDYVTFILTKRKGTENLYDVLTCYFDLNLNMFKNTALSNQEIYLRLSNLKRNK